MYTPKTSGYWAPRAGTGMWAWVLQRLSGIVITLYLFAHILTISSALAGGASFDSLMSLLENPLILALEMPLYWAILYHGLNGVRVVLFDLGIGTRSQVAIFWGMMAVAAVLFAAGVYVAWPYIMGKPLA